MRLNPEKPKSFALSVCNQRPPGGLSTARKPPGSNETKKKLCQFISILLTAVA
jgi:hypothetical protein